MSERPPCRLAALGMINALGADPDTIWPRLVAGDQTGLSRRDDLVADRTLLVGDVTDPLPTIPAHLARYACRNNALALAALRQIEAVIATTMGEVGSHRVAVVMGTSTSGVADAEAAIRHQQETSTLAPSFDYAQLEFGGVAGFVAAYIGARGPNYTLSTACSSGARALASARALLALGVCDAVVAGGADSLCGLTTNGFSALHAISAEVTNPCSVHRNGLTLGEGAALFLVTARSGGIQLIGVGESSEGHHMSAPDPNGGGAETAMRAALSDADLAAQDVAYLNLHGTGTPLNDQMECDAVARVFGTRLPCSSTKPMTGHTLGAAGAMEAGFCWMMLHDQTGARLPLPPHCWDGAHDPALPALHLVQAEEALTRSGVTHVMTNSFGFGGNNCVLVLGASSC